MTRVSRRRFLQISAAMAVAPSVAFAKPLEWRGFAFGAEVSIKLFGAGSEAQDVLDAAVARMIALEKMFSIYDPESLVSKLNIGGVLANPPPDFVRLLKQVDLVHNHTDGLFDPTVQRIFEAKAREIPFILRTAMSSTGWHRVSHDERSVKLPDPQMGVTFNGIAQGFITDEVKRTLIERGFEKTLVNIGEFAAGERVSQIGIADHDGKIFRIAKIQNEAIATTSPDGYRFRDGTSHIISPDGRSVEPKWKSISVVAKNAVLADGFSTALTLAPDTELAKRLLSSDLIKRVYLQNRNGSVQTL